MAFGKYNSSQWHYRSLKPNSRIMLQRSVADWYIDAFRKHVMQLIGFTPVDNGVANRRKEWFFFWNVVNKRSTVSTLFENKVKITLYYTIFNRFNERVMNVFSTTTDKVTNKPKII